MGDRLLAFVVVLGALIYLYADSQLPRLAIGDPLGPKVFPALIGIGLLAGGGLLLVEIWRKRRDRPKTTLAAGEPAERPHYLPLIGTAVCTAIYYAAFEPVGYVISTVVYMLVLLSYFHRGHLLANLAVAWASPRSPMSSSIGSSAPPCRPASSVPEMDSIHGILHGLAVASLPVNLLYTLIGVFIGTMISHLPGIGPSAGIALLIPVTFGMDPPSALMMLAGIYYGCMYGGAVTAILLNTPGDAAAVMTVLDGYPMARKGRAGAALAIAAVSSFIAGTLGVTALALIAMPLASLALNSARPNISR